MPHGRKQFGAAGHDSVKLFERSWKGEKRGGGAERRRTNPRRKGGPNGQAGKKGAPSVAAATEAIRGTRTSSDRAKLLLWSEECQREQLLRGFYSAPEGKGGEATAAHAGKGPEINR
mmetsp:Transcript_3355/g.7947  ORF Transcript_3355/g.7947 Transcript_3355/m.7947 type:complete len:117 (-) Transcript_3355:60-410(-)